MWDSFVLGVSALLGATLIYMATSESQPTTTIPSSSRLNKPEEEPYNYRYYYEQQQQQKPQQTNVVYSTQKTRTTTSNPSNVQEPTSVNYYRYYEQQQNKTKPQQTNVVYSTQKTVTTSNQSNVQQNYAYYSDDDEYYYSEEEEVDEDQRMFGKYKCTKCKRRWMSGNSWPNNTQNCKHCKIAVYPYELTPLEKVEAKDEAKIDKNKHHLTELCGKCKKLGYNCRSKPAWHSIKYY